MKPHKHAEIIKAWADGATIEVYQPAFGRWEEAEPAWHTSFEYRIKPELKLDVGSYLIVGANGWDEVSDYKQWTVYKKKEIIKLIRDGATGELKSAEVLK